MTTEHNEQKMRETEAAHPKSIEELTQYVESLVEGQHDYGTCVYAMSLAATAAYNFVASRLGVTGFQAGCADLDILRRTRHLNGPFMLVKGEDMLYPQYDVLGNVQKALTEWAPWAGEEARKKLDSHKHDDVHPNVWARWLALSTQQKKAV